MKSYEAVLAARLRRIFELRQRKKLTPVEKVELEELRERLATRPMRTISLARTMDPRRK